MCLYKHIKLVRRGLYWVIKGPHVTRFQEIHWLIRYELYMNFRNTYIYIVVTDLLLLVPGLWPHGLDQISNLTFLLYQTVQAVWLFKSPFFIYLCCNSIPFSW